MLCIVLYRENTFKEIKTYIQNMQTYIKYVQDAHICINQKAT